LTDIHRESYDLLILDWELPESSGIEVLRHVREQGDWQTPILFMTNRDNEQDIVHALELGADDYLPKPVSQEILRVRVNALGRRRGHAPQENSALQFGTYEFLPTEHRLTMAGESIKLTDKEYALALLLFTNMGQLFSRNHILENVWGAGPELTTRTVDTHISRLRRKMALLPENGWRLKAVYNFGYRLEQVSEV